nr:unnamed protein product [Callosobruchus chinensis]
MSLFPARADQTPNNKHSQEDQSWLQNSSFQPCQETSSTSNDVIRKTCRNSSNTDEYSDNDSCVSKRRRKLKHQKAKVKKVKHDTSAEQTRNDTYFIDLKGDRELLSVDTIYRPSAPIYPLPFCSKQSSNIRKSKFKRYHKLMLQKKIENDEVFYAEQSRQGEL